MNFEETKKHADQEITETYIEYLDKGYHIDLDKTSPSSVFLTKLLDVFADKTKAKFSRVQISENPIFNEKNFLEEQKYACKHPITPYLVSTATVIEPIDGGNIFNLSPLEITLIEANQNVQMSIHGFEKGE